MCWEPVFSNRCRRLSHIVKTQIHHQYLEAGSFRALHLLDSEHRAREMLLLMEKSFIRQATLQPNRKMGFLSPFQAKYTSSHGKPAHGADTQLCTSAHTFHFKGEGLRWQSWRFGSGFERSGKNDQRKHYLPFTKQFTTTDLAQVIFLAFN